MDRSSVRFAVFLFLIFLFVPGQLSAHPSPNDIPGISRQQLGLGITVIAVAIAALTYLWTGLKRSSRASTVREFFFFDKSVNEKQYFDVTNGYSFQVVITIYFIYWGFRYGIGIV